MLETFAREDRLHLVHEVARVLRERIYAGRYAPGEALRQVQISEELKVSRTPLREALRLLEREGLVTAQGPRGVSVMNVDLGELLDAYAMREMIDGLAASEASQRGDEAGIDRLFALIERQRATLAPWMPQEYTRLNVEFHTAIIEVAANKFLTWQLPIVRITSQVFGPRALLNRDRAVDAVEEHAEIVNAILRGDRAAAEAAARRHIRKTAHTLDAKLQDAPARPGN